MRIDCDSVILLSFLEGTLAFKARATTRLAAMGAAGDILAVSDLMRLECRMQPIRLGNAVRLAEYDGLFVQPNVECVPLTTAVYDRATVIRATHNFKLADSLHRAAAVQAGCDRFLTNDTRLSAFKGIPVEVLP
jgi:predicted nucleic acid-binding protein